MGSTLKRGKKSKSRSYYLIPSSSPMSNNNTNPSPSQNPFRYAVPLAALPEDPGLNEEFKECASTGSDGYASVRLVRSAVKVVHEVRLGATTVTQ